MKTGHNRSYLKIAAIMAGMFMTCRALMGGAENGSSVAADVQISRLHLFAEPLVWVGATAPSAAENEAFLDAVRQARSATNAPQMEPLESFLSRNPNSPWAPSLQANLGFTYSQKGYYTRALGYWSAAWEATRGFDSGAGKLVGDYTLVHWSEVLSRFCKVNDMEKLFAETKGRSMGKLHWQKAWNANHNALVEMEEHPEVAYCCGAVSLARVARALTNASAETEALIRLSAPGTGFSMSSLVALSERLHLDMVAVRRGSTEKLVVPSVMHFRQGHYAAIVEQRGNLYLVDDPSLLRPRWLTSEAINSEASGNFLISRAQMTADWQGLQKEDTDVIFGKGRSIYPPLPPPPPCPAPDDCEECKAACRDRDDRGHDGPGRNDGCGGCTQRPGAGMPTWKVSEPYISLWLNDKPMHYPMSFGSKFELNLSYHGEETRQVETTTFSFGPLWNCSWLSYMDVDDSQSTATLYGSGGGEWIYQFWNNTPSYYNKTTIERTFDGNGNLTAVKEHYPNGSQAVYGLLVVKSEFSQITRAFLTARIDAQGRTTQYRYETNNNIVKLVNVVDRDGLTNTLSYQNPNFPVLITQIENPFHDKVQIKYDATGLLTNLVDVVGISSVFQYTNIEGRPFLAALSTPYGTTLFDYCGTATSKIQSLTDHDNLINRAIKVTEPGGGNHLFVYRDDSYPMLPDNYSGSTNAPEGISDLCNEIMFYRNSFYWGPRQYSALSTTDLTQLSSADYGLGRLRNWLHSSLTGQALTVGRTLNMERAASPDGIINGQMTWYGYAGKNNPFEGPNYQPSYVAWKLPNGETHYTYKEYNAIGRVTREISTYSVEGGTRLRTNTFIYAENGTDLLQEIGPDGVVEVAYGYNDKHQVLFRTNAVGEVIIYTYDNNHQLTSVTMPSGLITTNIYQNSWLATTYDYSAGAGGTVYFRTNSYTYDKGLVKTHTDERGSTVTNSYDALNRLTCQSFPDKTTISNCYTVATSYPNGSGGLKVLDLTATKDRLNNWTYYAYDSMSRKTNVTDALNRTTSYEYCTCGSLEAVHDALGNVTGYYYDNLGQVTKVVYPDLSFVLKGYNLLGQLTKVTDSAGVSVTNWYNNQGLLYASSNAFGQVFSKTYDIEDRVIRSVDANGVVVSSVYDDLGRVLTRSSAGVETFGYSAAGLVAYTNQLGLTTRYGYDAARRKVAETNANQEVVQYVYSQAGDLIQLLDGKNQSTRWGYDAYGRVIYKMDALNTTILTYYYDANGRLTNRWSIEKHNTYFAYDKVGNLLNVTYDNGTSNSVFAYDAVNHLTNMSDGVGTTRFGYTPAGFLAYEDGPWDIDKVSYTYVNRLRQNVALDGTSFNTYGYDAANRLKAVNSTFSGNFTYTYDTGLGGTLSPSALVRAIALPNNATITNAFDDFGRETSTWMISSTGLTLDYSDYAYNEANQRTGSVRKGGDTISSVAYTYDPIGQLTSDLAKETASGTPRLNEQLRYAYDAAGNLKTRTNNTLVQSFGVNSLNELTTAGNTGKLTVIGATSTKATSVTVNTTNAILYADGTFAATNMPITSSYTAVAQDALGRQDTTTINVNLPASVGYLYDGNGNLINDGLRTFVYDAENQLIRITGINGTTPWKTEFSYDGKMRRRIRTESVMPGSTWLTNLIVRYIYDGNLVIQERDGNNVAQVTYTRGKDLSGSLEGAGGIGGLLARTDNGTNAFYHSDGNGNVTALANGSQTVVAKYLYDAFGNVLSKSGSLADLNLYRFSSKEWHQNSGLVYYLYRYYDPNLQRWVNRDPISDRGHVAIRTRKALTGFAWSLPIDFEPNAYEFVKANPISLVDALGLFSIIKVPNVPFFFACPTLTGHIYSCTMKVTLTVCPPKPQLIPCVGHAVEVMLAGCEMADFNTFSMGCGTAKMCFDFIQ